MQNGGEALSSFIMACRGISVKMLITLKLHGILDAQCEYITFHIIANKIVKTKEINN